MKKILKFVAIVLFFVILLAGTVLGYLTVDEYDPDDVVPIELEKSAAGAVRKNETIRLMSWNVGYGALGDNADFFMDGGRMVNTADEERVRSNLDGVVGIIDENAPDILLLQELDRYSTRSHYIDELEYIRDSSSANAVKSQSAFAYNFYVSFVPLPVPPIGKVQGGIGVFSEYEITEAERIKLPCPFSWPLRTMNLKRCLEVLRLPVEGSDKELVLVNLHLEAYDDGEGKAMQTEVLKEVLEQELEKGNYVIAGGDFNQEFSNADTSAYPVIDGMWRAGKIDVSEFDSDLAFVTDVSCPSCRSLDRVLADAKDKSPEAFQYYVIDGFIFSENIEIKNVSTINTEFVYTDHNPLLAEIVLK